MPKVFGILEKLDEIKAKLGTKYNAEKLQKYLNNNITKYINQEYYLNNNNTPKIKPMEYYIYLGRYDEDGYFGNHVPTNMEKKKARRDFMIEEVLIAVESRIVNNDDEYNRDGGPPKHELNRFPNNYVIIKVTFDNAPFINMSPDEKLLEGFFVVTQSGGAQFNTFLDNLNNDPLFTNAASAANAGGSYRRTRIRRRKNRMSRRKRTARRKH